MLHKVIIAQGYCFTYYCLFYATYFVMLLALYLLVLEDIFVLIIGLNVI